MDVQLLLKRGHPRASYRLQRLLKKTREEPQWSRNTKGSTAKVGYMCAVTMASYRNWKQLCSGATTRKRFDNVRAQQAVEG